MINEGMRGSPLAEKCLGAHDRGYIEADHKVDSSIEI